MSEINAKITVSIPSYKTTLLLNTAITAESFVKNGIVNAQFNFLKKKKFPSSLRNKKTPYSLSLN